MNRRRRGASAVLLAGGLLLVGAAGAGCTSVGARAHNLGQLHAENGFHRQSAVLMGDFEWEMREGLGGLLSSDKIDVEEKQARRIKKPLDECLENLRELEEARERGDHERAQKVAALARWVVECPWQLSRERCALALGGLGTRLELGAHPPRPLEGEPVGVDELSAALSALVAAVRPTLERGSVPDPGAIDAVSASCDALGELPYDLDGARRALDFVALIAERASPRKEVHARVLRLQRDLERLTVQRALTVALRDELPFERSGSDSGWNSIAVRAAALEGLLASFGAPALAEFLVQLDGRTEAGLLVVLLEAVVERGLPSDLPDVPAADQAVWRERWITRLVQIATQHPEGPVRVSAMRALSTASGGELTSLREEDWLVWETARRAAAGPPPAAPGGSSRAPRAVPGPSVASTRVDAP